MKPQRAAQVMLRGRSLGHSPAMLGTKPATATWSRRCSLDQSGKRASAGLKLSHAFGTIAFTMANRLTPAGALAREAGVDLRTARNWICGQRETTPENSEKLLAAYLKLAQVHAQTSNDGDDGSQPGA